ncbi:lectin-like domain-containing protein [Companilactobacillus kedongensis]|uniref:lectin-like domain-containing protein n=1 Tax=Companilactobacillus kedongensis TaxID=2486004 RepID=UPI000F7762B5|nr:hypothetical protein [Companilactobacillus kedongensis]
MVKCRIVYAILMVILSAFTATLVVITRTNNLAKAEIDDDYKYAISTAPQGLKIDKNTFYISKFPENSAKVVASTNPNTHDTDIVQITNNRNQLGAIWSKVDNRNYIDINNEQTFSMWMYFGKQNSQAGDGMALVLQNDSREAIAKGPDGKPLFGQTLGVWGGDFDNNLTDPNVIANMAIKNSWAVEFDTFEDKNIDYKSILGLNNSFDATRNGDHIAYNYPDSPETYMSKTAIAPSSGVTPRHYFEMKHNVIRDNMNLSDGKWHHVTMCWDPTTSTMQLAYDDKEPDGTDTSWPIISTMPIDVSHFKLTDNKLRWGFTGATGTEFENNMVVFESIPAYVKGRTSTQIFDVTRNKYLDSTIKGKAVNNGDDLELIYNLEYLSGSKEWEGITASIDLPTNLIYTGGSIIYEDGSIEDIPLSKLKDKQLVYKLQRNLSENNLTAQIKLDGIANSDHSINIAKTHSSFKGDSFITYDDLQAFNIKVNKQILIDSKKENPIKLDKPADINIEGTARYLDNSYFYNRIFLLHTVLNGASEKTTSMSSDTLKGVFNTLIKSGDLRPGKNTLKIFVTDLYGNYSNELNFEIQIGKGTVAFGNVQKTVSFHTIHGQLPGSIIPRQGSWQVEVVDDRPAGASWEMQVYADSLYKGNDKFNGNIVYRDQEGKINPIAEPLSIFKQTKDVNDSQKINISDFWDSDRGVLLKMDGSNLMGEYSGQIHWVLIDGV